MSSIYISHDTMELSQDNVTTRRSAPRTKVGMVPMELCGDDYKLSDHESLLLESILSLDEAKDVISMLDMADELGDVYRLPSFITSTQMAGRDQRRRPTSPPLSPVPQRAFALVTHDLTNGHMDCSTHTVRRASEPCLPCLTSPKSMTNGGDQTDIVNWDMRSFEGVDMINSGDGYEEDAHGETGSIVRVPSDLVDSAVVDLAGGRAGDPLTSRVGDGRITTTTNVTSVSKAHGADGSKFVLVDVSRATSVDDDEDRETYSVDGQEGTSQASGESNSDGGGNVTHEHEQAQPTDEMADPTIVAAKLKLMEGMIALLDNKSTRLEDTVRSLEDSLDYSYKEIVDLKKENNDLRLLMGNLEMEDRRTQSQVNDFAEKLDRLDSVTKKENLLFEGIPESAGKNEDTHAVICTVFDQLSVNHAINFDACYRFGPVSKIKPRPILVTFERQTDRDMIYARRTELRRSKDFAKVWINEDVSAASKRKREMIRLISREAQQQGIDCRTGKYAVHIDRKRYDGTNFDDLPLPLQPANLKQVQVDQNTLAYQSEYAPLSNFYPCQIIIGKHKFFCAEQAFQFLRAKLLNKPLAATRIYLSRDVRYIKQLGQELGSSTEWNDQQFDYMYICLKKKFTQNAELKTLLLGTGNMELVEATPDCTWGCGATLSSNVLKQHTWPGMNKHGKILMTIREELRSGDLENNMPV